VTGCDGGIRLCTIHEFLCGTKKNDKNLQSMYLMFRPRFERRIFGMQFRFLLSNRLLGLQQFEYTLFTSYSYVSAVDEYGNYVIGLH